MWFSQGMDVELRTGIYASSMVLSLRLWAMPTAAACVGRIGCG